MPYGGGASPDPREHIRYSNCCVDPQSQVAIGDFPVWLDLSLFPCLLLGSAASGQESEEMWLVLQGG